MKIKIDNLTKVYGQDASALLALSELELEIQQSEILIIKGPNGSGKSTLISILAGDINPTVGQIKIDNESESAPVISVVKQFENLIDELTIQEHFIKFNNEENIDLIPVEILGSKPEQISRGQAQRVAIALALSSKTDLLLADEPTGALGLAESEEIYKFIKETAVKNKTAVILVTHDENAEKYADRVIRLRDGRVGEIWLPGQKEQEVVSKKGWVRIPEIVRDGLADSIDITGSEDGAVIKGRIRQSSVRNAELKARSSSNTNLIKISDLTIGYGQNIVARDLNSEINKNDLFCIFGKSGIGKTTLVKSICGLHKPISGEISKSAALEIPYFNIEEPFALELKLSQLVQEGTVISDLNLDQIANRPLKTYSGGQLQRAIVAIALSSESEIIALDEPTSALDDQMCELVISVLLNSKKTLITTSHDPRLRKVATNTLELQ